MRVKILVFGFTTLLFFSNACFANISGYVKDFMGNPVIGAAVTFTDESDSNNVFSSTTDSDGKYEINELVTNVDENEQSTPQVSTLQQNYPNPFNPATTIPFSLNKAGFINLTIYNLLGQKVRTLVHGHYSSGLHNITWDGLDDNGMGVGAGIYIYQLKSGNKIESKKMLLLDGVSYSAAGKPFHLMSYNNTASKPGVTVKISINNTYYVHIAGENIETFEKSGITLMNTGPTLDFFVSRVGSGFHLSIIHTNDDHSHILPYNYNENTVTFDENISYGGSTRIAAMSRRLRNQRQNVLMLSAGDHLPRYKYSPIVMEAEQKILNLLDYDYITLGNWDFNYGPLVLADFISGLNTTIVSANVNVENEPLLFDLFEPYQIKEIDGHKVGIMGYVTTDPYSYMNLSEKIVIEDIDTSIQNALNELENQGINIVIALNHSGYSYDMEIASKFDGIDIIVGGHSHSLLSTTDEKASGLYPTIIESPSGESVLIVQAKSFNDYLGCLDVTFDENGVVTDWSGQPYKMDNSVPHDKAMLEVVMDYYTVLKEFF
ncbi:MAG: T9SS type A sorting domain-containing protein [Candidatus Latescibacteria bacterium]|jgi:hypothetical protein|nr:T9SS type A sorting domain-containing protein [Candidatus Latescibacterota bacterium]